jgi:protein-tyrosine kinase
MSTTLNDQIMPGGAGTVVDAETYEPVSKQVISATEPAGVAAEQYRILRFRLEELHRTGIRAIAFTSAQGSEGKTTTAVNAALELSRGGRHRVVLVDADLRRPRVHRLLGLTPREGFSDVVAGRAPLGNALWRFGSEQLHVLPAGTPPDEPSDTLFHPHLPQLFRELKERFDFILVDSTSALRLADVPTLCRELDGALMVVRARSTPRELLFSAIRSLEGVRLHGLILNDVDPAEQHETLLPLPSDSMLALPPKMD